MITGISDGITWKSDKNDLFTLTHFRIFKLSYFFPKVINMTRTHVFASFGSSLSVFHEKKNDQKNIKKVFFFRKKLKNCFFSIFCSDFFTLKSLPKMWNFFWSFFLTFEIYEVSSKFIFCYLRQKLDPKFLIGPFKD